MTNTSELVQILAQNLTYQGKYLEIEKVSEHATYVYVTNYVCLTLIHNRYGIPKGKVQLKLYPIKSERYGVECPVTQGFEKEATYTLKADDMKRVITRTQKWLEDQAEEIEATRLEVLKWISAADEIIKAKWHLYRLICSDLDLARPQIHSHTSANYNYWDIEDLKQGLRVSKNRSTGKHTLLAQNLSEGELRAIATTLQCIRK